MPQIDKYFLDLSASMVHLDELTNRSAKGGDDLSAFADSFSAEESARLAGEDP